jgi:hypothetical protein
LNYSNDQGSLSFRVNGDDEIFYRFMPPDPSNLYGLKPGVFYTLSGLV